MNAYYNDRFVVVAVGDPGPPHLPYVVAVANTLVGDRLTLDGMLVPQADTPERLAALKEAALSDLAKLRYAKEGEGVQAGALTIKTDEGSQAKLSAAYTVTKDNLVATIDWKGKDGWDVVGFTDIAGVSTLVAGYIEACFSRERALYELVQSATTPEDVMAVRAQFGTGWPA